jgi:catechol 2,3-dioxygenase-like lactoylglutathione lyase family enzyme
MSRSIAAIALLVPDYDAAIAHYCGDLGFELIEDTDLGSGKRWVRIRAGQSGATLLLAKAQGKEQQKAIGNQSGGRVFLFLETDNFAQDHAAFVAKGVYFTEIPRNEAYGQVAVFKDRFGNRWDLIERTQKDTL